MSMLKQVMSDLEAIVFGFLTRRKIKFEFQSQLLGGYANELGSATLDFVFRDTDTCWRILGEYYHRGVTPEARDEIQKVRLQEMGWTVIDIFGDDLKKRLEYTLTQALRGQEVGEDL